ncbi:Transcription factor iws1 [Ascosphaera pollenicola]|nr:Transcription factor iws1 [Ascosphaera pollenicola]
MKTSPAFLFLAPLLGFASAAAPSCSRDEDCSLNGICNNATSRCTCDPGWRGTDCGILDLAPAPRKGNGYNMTSAGISSWCNQIVHDPRNKSVYHLFLSEFTHGCSLDYWTPYSRVIRAESTDGPAGPYVYRDEIVPAFAHNPSVVYSPVDEAYFLYYVGCKTEVNAEKCETKEFTCGPGNDHNGESGISAMISKDLITWEPYGQVMTGVDDKSGRLWDADVTNPGAFALPNGELAMAFRGCPFNCDVGKEWIGLAIGNTPRGTFHKVSAEAPLFSENSEDPFIWQDKRGNWHLLVHSLEADGGFDGQPNVGRHAYAKSLEGPWTFDNKTVAYTTTVDFDDGSQILYHRRERPQLLFSEDESMRPLYLTNGVQEKGTHASYSLVQPIKGA